MDKGPNSLEWWLWTFGYAAFAAFGGALGFVMRQLDQHSDIKFWRVVFEMFCAAFAGVMVMLVCQATQMSVQWTGIAVGVFGWLGGSAAMRYLEKIVSRKLGANDNDQSV